MAQETPLIVIVGPTASGKSTLALAVAERYNGEIISADSRTVYIGIDIGTAKPSIADQARVPHHLLNVISPNEKFSAAEFKRLANLAIIDITSRGKLPIMVGGTGLYVDSVIYDFDFLAGDNERDPLNPRHRKPSNLPKSPRRLRENTLIIGLRVPQEELRQKVEERVMTMLGDGLEQEVREISQRFGWNAEAMTGLGYKEWYLYFERLQSIKETSQLIITHTMQYAKRQHSWFKRNPNIKWVVKNQAAHKIVKTFLQQFK